MSDLFDEPEGATPLDPDEREGLLLQWIETRADLNQAETANIEKGIVWAHRSRKAEILTEEFIRTLHKHMFGDVWAWAGQFRQTEKSVGVDPAAIAVDLRKLLGDVAYWMEHAIYPPDEIAMRLHRGLAWIHPFPNGNGRHARQMADMLARKLGQKPFSWGVGGVQSSAKTRETYIKSLRIADRDADFAALIAFARS